MAALLEVRLQHTAFIEVLVAKEETSIKNE